MYNLISLQYFFEVATIKPIVATHTTNTVLTTH